MRQFISIIVLLLSFCVLNSSGQVKTVYDELVYVNKEWKNQRDVNPILKSKSAIALNEQELVRMHLKEVESLLRKRSTEHLSVLQKKNRERNLNVLHGYWEKGVFPMNSKHMDRQPYFIDDKGIYCAVGYLMKESGADDVAKDINKTQNYSYLEDIDHPKLMEWVNNSGLDFGELALIQPGYGGEYPCTLIELHYNNVGTDVNEYIEVHQGYSQLVGYFSFDSIYFYNSTSTLYKKLSINQMSVFVYAAHMYYYYVFPSIEDLADIGRIEILCSSCDPWYRNLERIDYNSSGITKTNPTLYPSGKTFTTIESNTTPVGNSLNFCGNMNNTNGWDTYILPTTIGSLNPCVAIPINLSSFNYIINNKNVVIKWETSQEINSDHFEVERSSDGINFSSLGSVRAAGNSNSARQYSLVDNHPNYMNHYRLKEVDIDGKMAYSKILFVKMQNASVLALGENLLTNSLEVNVNTTASNAGEISVYDFSGREVIHVKAVNGKQNINVATLSAGKYIVRLRTWDGGVYTAMFVKE